MAGDKRHPGLGNQSGSGPVRWRRSADTPEQLGLWCRMADRDPIHQQASAKSGMEFGAKIYRLPLLPFERQIIDLIGCSEEEYRRFAAEAERRGRLRPAGYEHIPDVRADLVSIGIALFIGIASSVASYLLTPKPKPLRDNSSTRNLDSINGSSRFSPTTGFDSQAELANYGDPIPILFGRYTGTSGGMLVSPKLVWSRMFSYGTQQGVKLLFVVGEQGYTLNGSSAGISPPSLQGIFVGNGALSLIYENTFAFYWKNSTTVQGFSRIKAANLLYGTRATGATGDPESQDDVFSCPTRTSDIDTGFSSVHSLSNNAQFGCYAPIPNGTGYRVNWRIVPFPRDPDGVVDDPGNTQLLERIKIAGNNNGLASANDVRSGGMFGTGRNYSRRMGITSHNGYTVPDSLGTQERNVAIGDVIQFTISETQIPENLYAAGSVKVDDINSASNEERIAADSALQVGEIFMIARTLWQVTARSIPVWRPEDKRSQIVTLKCIDIVGRNVIGLVANTVLTRDYLTDTETGPYFIGPSYYPLLRCDLASVRNTRACDITEIGIRSQVYQRLNGICNFQSLPSPSELYAAERQRISLQSGSITSYVRRSSSFTLFVRPAGVDASGKPYEWTDFGIRFVVVGNEPVDQYNYIRLKHPSTQQYEYKFIPKNGADMRNTDNAAVFWLLNASSSGSRLTSNYDTIYGRFTISASGVQVFKTNLQQNIEFLNKPTPGAPALVLPTYPSVVAIAKFFPEEEAGATYPTSLALVLVFAMPESVSDGRMASFAWEIFGSADASSVVAGGTTTATALEQIGSRSLIIRYTARKDFRIGHYSGQNHTWAIVGYEVISATGNWVLNEQVAISRTISSSNPFKSAPGGPITSSGVILSVAGTRTVTEIQGRAQGFYEQLFGPARNLPVGSVGTQTINFSDGTKIIQIVLRSTTYSNPLHWSGANFLWNDPTITVQQTSATSQGLWKVGDVFDVYTAVTAGNPFRPVGSSVGAQFRVDALVQALTPPSLISAARAFEGSSQFADVSFYGNQVEKSNNSAPEHTVVYVNEMVSNSTTPNYDRLTVAGLALKASRNFSTLDQIRFWLADGCPVKRFHPDDGNTVGPSNLFSDLVFHLLTDQTAGVGRVLNMTPDNPSLINTDDFVTTAKFLKANKLFFDGAISSPVNLRQYIADTAPYFLCNFVISDGKFGIVPALPTTAAGAISLAPLPIKALFTAGNILEDSFELDYLPAEERKEFQAVIRYRQETRNQLPEERTLAVRWADAADYSPVESFDLTGYCTTQEHAKLVGKFFLSVRKRVTHTVRFKTAPYGISLAPGEYIKVATEASPYNAARNGTIGADGVIVSALPLVNGTYNITYYKVGSDDVADGVMTVSGGKATQSSLWSSVFTIREATRSESVYMVEQLTLDEDGSVQIVASEYPCDSSLVSTLARDVLTDSLFTFEN